VTSEVPPEAETLLATRIKTLKDDMEIWRLRYSGLPEGLSQRVAGSNCKIITIGNLKGGVGKTTTTANLAAYCDIVLEKRTLVIDLDYQGSLTAIMLQAAKKRIDVSHVDHAIAGTYNGAQLVGSALELPGSLEKTDLLTAGYTLQQTEDQLLARWLFHTIETDPRLNLEQALLSKEVQERYDVVLLDMGPRLTVASLSAIFASTHILVPTNLDALAAETVESFLTQLGRVKRDFDLSFEVA